MTNNSPDFKVDSSSKTLKVCGNGIDFFLFFYKNDPRKVYLKRINEDNVLIELTFLLIGYTPRVEGYIDPADQSKDAHTRVSLLE